MWHFKLKSIQVICLLARVIRCVHCEIYVYILFEWILIWIGWRQQRQFCYCRPFSFVNWCKIHRMLASENVRWNWDFVDNTQLKTHNDVTTKFWSVWCTAQKISTFMTLMLWPWLCDKKKMKNWKLHFCSLLPRSA